MQFECRIAELNSGLAQFGQLPQLAEFIEQHFFAGSNGDIVITCYDPKAVAKPLPAAQAVSALQLHTTLVDLTNNSTVPTGKPVSRIGVLLADSYAAFAPALGVMFDRGFTTEDDPNAAGMFTAVPRQGCAIFLGSIFKLRHTDAQYLEEVRFTAVHELGHVFNLQHDTDSINFMTPS